MQRREFLVRLGGVLVAVPATLTAISCGGDDDDDTPSGDFTITSDGAAHTHKVTIKCADLSSSSEVSYTSTTDAGHNHMFSLTGAELTSIKGGGSVTKMVMNATHSHNFVIMKGSSC